VNIVEYAVEKRKGVVDFEECQRKRSTEKRKKGGARRHDSEAGLKLGERKEKTTPITTRKKKRTHQAEEEEEKSRPHRRPGLGKRREGNSNEVKSIVYEICY